MTPELRPLFWTPTGCRDQYQNKFNFEGARSTRSSRET